MYYILCFTSLYLTVKTVVILYNVKGKMNKFNFFKKRVTFLFVVIVTVECYSRIAVTKLMMHELDNFKLYFSVPAN
jgi:hypothetical protein